MVVIVTIVVIGTMTIPDDEMLAAINLTGLLVVLTVVVVDVSSALQTPKSA